MSGSSKAEIGLSNHTGLVYFLLEKFHRRHPDSLRISSSEELIAAGNIGLAQALKTFDPNRGYKFSTHAGRRIWSRMFDAFKADRKIYDHELCLPGSPTRFDDNDSDEPLEGFILDPGQPLEEIVEQRELFQQLHDAATTGRLSTHESRILSLYLKNLTTDKVGEQLGITGQAVRATLRQKIIPKLRRHLNV